jgi:hypothetical protein
MNIGISSKIRQMAITRSAPEYFWDILFTMFSVDLLLCGGYISQVLLVVEI